MSSTTDEIGKQGERLALGHLKKMGYKIIECNVSTRFGEVDILAKHRKKMVLVEVKTMETVSQFGHPVFRINQRKKNKLKNMARRLLQKYNLGDTDIRFDVVTVDLTGKKPDIVVLENAF